MMLNSLKLSPLLRMSISCRQMSSKSAEEVLFALHGKSGVMTLNRPKGLNALNMNMVRQMMPMVRQWASDDAVKVVVLEGAGSKAFCAGGDVVAVAHSTKGDKELSRAFFKEEYILDYHLSQLKKPYVALIDGITMGGGVGLSINAPFRVATEKTVFAMPETNIGLFPDVSGSFFLPRLPNYLGTFLALSGTRLKSEDVFSAGIATHFVDSQHIPEIKAKLADCHDDVTVLDLLDSYHVATDQTPSYQPHADKIGRVFSKNTAIDMFETLETMKQEGDEWAADLLKTMRKMCPMSICVTVEQLKRGAHMPLNQCFFMEYRLVQHFMNGPDFYEGVRALLLDKDLNPKWQHASVEDVTPDEIQRYFDGPIPGELTLADLV